MKIMYNVGLEEKNRCFGPPYEHFRDPFPKKFIGQGFKREMTGNPVLPPRFSSGSDIAVYTKR